MAENIIQRGATEDLIFDVDTDLTECDRIYVTFEQNGEAVVEKTIEDTEATATTLTVKMTQADSLAFDNDLDAPPIWVQIRAGWPSGGRGVSDTILAWGGRLIKDGEI